MFDSKYGKIALIGVLAVFSVFFLFYFYNLATVSQPVIENLGVKQIKRKKIIVNNLNINLELFKKDKFKKLKAVGASIATFDIGKRNPFNKE